MHNVNLWHKLHLHGPKVILLFSVLLTIACDTHAQKVRWVKKNNPNYDDRKISYGFLIGIHTNAYQIKYSDEFVTQPFDTVQSVLADWSTGFSLGFIVNYKVADYLDLRLTPKVSFYEYKLQYVYTSGAPYDALTDPTMVELPLLAKYKSARRGNVRMYLIGGINPGIEASGRKEGENGSASIEIKQFNLNLEGGFGFDFYYPLFKFSPEIRFSRGLVNVLADRTSVFGQPLQRVNTNTISIYFLFQ